MAKGIYSSGMSCWERNRAGLPADHAGPGTIPSGEVKKAELKPEKVEEVVEEVVVESTTEKPKAKDKDKKKAGNKSIMDKLKGKK